MLARIQHCATRPVLELIPIGALTVEQSPWMDFYSLLNANGGRHNLIASLRRMRALGRGKIGRRQRCGNNDQRSQRHYCIT